MVQFQQIQQSLLKDTAKWLLGEFLILLVIFVLFLRDQVAKLVKQCPSEYWLANIILILIAIIIVLLSYISILLYKYRLKPAFNLLWDKDINPYCPVCRTLCSYTHSFEYDKGSFHCPKCKEDIIPTHSSGHQLSYTMIKDSFAKGYEK